MALFTFADNTYGTIASGITSVATSITLTTGHGVRFPAVSGTILPATLINSSNVVEQIHITAHTANSDSLTVTRAANGTTGKAWSAGDRIEVRQTSEFLNIAALLFGSTDAVDAFSLLPSVTTLTVGAGASVASTFGHASAATLFPGGITASGLITANAGVTIPTGQTLAGAGAINISGNITGGATGNISSLTADDTINDNTTISLFSPLVSGGIYFITVGSGDNNVYAHAIVTNNGSTLRIATLANAFFSFANASGLQLQLVLTAAGSAVVYNARAIRLR